MAFGDVTAMAKAAIKKATSTASRPASSYDNRQQPIGPGPRPTYNIGSDLITADVQRMLQYALSAVGRPYMWGGNDLSRGVDCSGLIYQAFYAAGYNLPRTAANQQNWAQPIQANQARVGDLVFWAVAGSKDRVPGADHVGIYLGNGQVLEASSGQNKVVIRKLWGNYTFGRVVGARDRASGYRDVKLGPSGIDPNQFLAGAPLGAFTAGGGEFYGGADPYGVAAAQVQTRLPANATPEQILEFVTQNYGPAIAAFAKIPDLWNVVIEAGRKGVTSPDLVQQMVERTTWWKSRTESMRNWDLLKATNPKEAQARLDQQMAALRPVVNQLGADLELNSFAEQVIRLGWDENQMNNHLANVLQYESDRSGLDEGTTADISADQLMAIARTEFFVPMDRQTAERWAIDIFRGNKTEEQWEAYLATMSRGRFNHLTDEIASGITPGQYFAPIRNMIAETLELNPADIDLLDQRYSEILDYVDPTTGKSRPMTLGEASRWARKQEGFKETQTANSAAGDVVELLGQTFGKVR